MKKILTLVLLLSAYAAMASYTLPQESPKVVYVCVSETAYAYHAKRDCKFLSRCTHAVKAVSIEKAKELGKKKPCKGCCK
ncbi:MAG: hypothetical protein IJ764_02130 [Bacteroidales bacterium]|nr:hypothetical protein [Bacteroidales bacterium]